jgi:uncharacterized protein
MRGIKTVRDAVHGDVPLSRLELKLLDTVPMQRLRGIRQLGTSYLVYPSAQHTRFEHSIGTCYMAKILMDALKNNSPSAISPDDEKAVAVAALLHDVTHIPFGHTLEDERRIFARHDADSERLEYFVSDGEIGQLLASEKLKDRVIELLQEKHSSDQSLQWSSQVISHTICADLLDYLRRDSRFCGLNIDFDNRIFRYFNLENNTLILNLQKGGLFRHDAFSEVIHLLRIRYFLTERVYYHHAKIAAGAMLSRAVERCVELGFDSSKLYELSDDALLYLLKDTFFKDAIVKRLMACYTRRALYKRCYVLTDHRLTAAQRQKFSRAYHLNTNNQRSKTEKRIAREAGIPLESVIIYAPPPKMNLKEADVLVKVDGRQARPLGDWQNQEVISLQEKYGKLWKLYVFVDPEYAQRFTIVSQICTDVFKQDNDLPMIQRGQMSLFST